MITMPKTRVTPRGKENVMQIPEIKEIDQIDISCKFLYL